MSSIRVCSLAAIILVVIHLSSGLECIWIDGECSELCPEGTHSYSPGCGEVHSQPTCEKPVPQNMGIICDLSRCDCDLPRVLEEKSGKCLKLEECP